MGVIIRTLNTRIRIVNRRMLQARQRVGALERLVNRLSTAAGVGEWTVTDIDRQAAIIDDQASVAEREIECLLAVARDLSPWVSDVEDAERENRPPLENNASSPSTIYALDASPRRGDGWTGTTV